MDSRQSPVTTTLTGSDQVARLSTGLIPGKALQYPARLAGDPRLRHLLVIGLVLFSGVRAEAASSQLGTPVGPTGKGVTLVILDRGIDWTHPDFRNADGSTRIKALLDMTGQGSCPGSPAATEYDEATINAALAGTIPRLPTRDAVGHGTVTAGLAAGNGFGLASREYAGVAPQAT